MNPAVIAIAEKLWRLIRSAVHETGGSEESAMMMLNDRIFADPELASALTALTTKDEEEMGLLLWREIAAGHRPRS